MQAEGEELEIIHAQDLPAFLASRSRRGGLRAILSAFSAYLFLAGLLVAPFAVLSAAPARADTPVNTPFITWNMQGATSLAASMWTDYIPRMLDNNPTTQVVMLQEAGPNPPDTSAVQPNPSGDPRVSYYIWNRGSAPRPKNWYIYYLQSSNPRVPGGRVNTIVMARTQADQVMVVDSPIPAGQQAIGLRLGNDWYFSYHALTGGGGDAVSMLTAIGQAVANAQQAGVTYNWTVGADFNTEPNTLENRHNYAAIPTPTGNLPAIIASGQHAHAQLLPDGTYAFRELDYAVTTTPSPRLLRANIVPTNGGSDHQAVGVTPVPTRPAPTVAAPDPAYVIGAMPTGGYAVNGSNASSVNGYSGMREPTRVCVQRYQGKGQSISCTTSPPPARSRRRRPRAA